MDKLVKIYSKSLWVKPQCKTEGRAFPDFGYSKNAAFKSGGNKKKHSFSHIYPLAFTGNMLDVQP